MNRGKNTVLKNVAANYLALRFSGPPKAGSGPGENFFGPTAEAERLKVFT